MLKPSTTSVCGLYGGRRDERPVVAEMAIDLVAQQHDVPLGRQLGNAADFFLRGHHPRGIGGAVEDDHLRPRRDRGRHAVHVDAKVGIGVDVDHLAPATAARASYITKYGSKTITSSPGFTSTSIASMMPPLVPLVTNNSRSAWPNCRSTSPAASPAAPACPATGHSRSCGSRWPRSPPGGPRPGLEIGLADGEVDRIGELRAQIEHLADTGGVETLVRSASQCEDMIRGSGGMDPFGIRAMNWQSD